MSRIGNRSENHSPQQFYHMVLLLNSISKSEKQWANNKKMCSVSDAINGLKRFGEVSVPDRVSEDE